uniref:Uncharacterized protein n=1 Tax=Euplotes crassus TaxID=5936 RepID=A0A7S3KUA6_EUPCR|mmetsp:Transcript_8941/g.8496  ORF Transcript_8941/g.8496 Transcript_8941/m.8496 type:complete len:114 (+) Transcript_8941:116-457(+)
MAFSYERALWPNISNEVINNLTNMNRLEWSFEYLFGLIPLKYSIHAQYFSLSICSDETQYIINDKINSTLVHKANIIHKPKDIWVTVVAILKLYSSEKIERVVNTNACMNILI